MYRPFALFAFGRRAGQIRLCFGLTRRFFVLALALTSILPAMAGAQEGEGAKVNFNLPAGEAGTVLKQFAQQAKREVMFAAKPLRGVTTNAVQGLYTVKEGLKRLLAGTELRGFIDEKTGAVVVQRSNDPNGQRAAQMGRDRPIK